jgi:tetratricopeptide (TPR) repeat protein
MAVNTLPPEQADPRFRWTSKRLLLLFGGLIAVFLLTYLLAWYGAYRLSQIYLSDADTSYDSGEFLNALLGYEEFDQTQNRYVDYGGYVQIERIWSDSYAQPVPPDVVRARERIDEIINSRLTIEEAEQFVQENAGRGNHPYLGLIYLRLGELYAAAERFEDAADVFSSFADLFPGNETLIERARQDLEQIQGQISET